jgi:hypothetical protein
MKQAQIAKLVVLVLVVLFVGAASFFFGDKHALESMTIRQVTPTEIAQAMKDDHFWQTYRENTLLVKGTVSSVSNPNGDVVIGLKTESSYKSFCDLGVSDHVFETGDQVTVMAESGPAERQPSAVLLKGCVLL